MNDNTMNSDEKRKNKTQQEKMDEIEIKNKEKQYFEGVFK